VFARGYADPYTGLDHSTLYSTIEDEELSPSEKSTLREMRKRLGFAVARQRKRFLSFSGKDCVHRECLEFHLPGSSPLRLTRPAPNGGEDVINVAGRSAGYSASFTPPSPDPAKVDAAFRGFAEQMPTQTLMPNFFWELRHPKEIIKNLVSLRNKFKPSGMSFKYLRKYLGKRWLAWSFEIKPLIADIQAFLESISAVRKRLLWLQKTAGTPTIVRKWWREHIDVPEEPEFYFGPVPLGPYISFDAMRLYSRSLQYSYTVKYVVGCTIHHNVAVVDDFLNLTSGLLAYFGFNRPLSIIWEAIPWSWLIDYFVKIGNLLDTVKSSDPFPGQINLTNGWVSTKVEHVSQIRSCRIQPPSGFAVSEGELTTSVATQQVWSYYRRNAGIQTSSGFHLRFGKSLTLQQYLNLAAATS